MRSLAVIFLTLVSAVLGQLDSLDYCYGEVSICAEANDLAAPCDQLVDETQDTKYWQCLCGSGYVSTNEACHWCAVAFDDPLDVYDGALETSACASVGATIAPIPSSIVAAISALNATYTGVIPTGGSGGGTGQAGVGATAPGSGVASVTQKASVTKSSSSETSPGFFGLPAGSSTIVTVDGGGSPLTTAAPFATNSGAGQSSSSTPKAASGSGRAQSWNTGVAALLSVTVFGLTVLYTL